MAYRYDEEKIEKRKRERAEAEERQWLEDMDRTPEKFGMCYFIGCEEGLVKIGYSKDVANRLTQIRSTTPYRLRLLAKTTGGKERETYYHRKFSEHRYAGEWFHITPEILDEIDRINFSNPAPDRLVIIDECRTENRSTPYAGDLGKPSHCNRGIICLEGKR